MATPANRTPLRQDFSTVSNTTNQGLPTTPQHVLREAQQQRTARPGPGQQQHYVAMAAAHDERFLISPQGTPHSQRFDAACFEGVPGSQQQDCMGIPYDAYNGQISLMVKKNQAGYPNNMNVGQYLDLDVSRLDDGLLQEDRRVPERRLGLAHGRLDGPAQALGVDDPPHAAPATAGDGLDEDREP